MEATTATKPSSIGGSSSITGTVPGEESTSSLAHGAAPAPLRHLSIHPLVSAFSAAYVLGALYLPRCILSLLLSPALVSSLLLLATLFYFGSSSSFQHDHPQTRSPPRQQPRQEEEQEQDQHKLLSFRRPPTSDDAEFDSPVAVLCSNQKPLLLPEHHHFVEWPRWGPLEVIYEEYEEEVDDEDDEDAVRSPGYCGSPWQGRGLGTKERVAPPSYGDDSDDDDDSASSSGDGSSPAWELPEDLFVRWEAEEEGLIEIPLEEDNLIEIDISACR